MTAAHYSSLNQMAFGVSGEILDFGNKIESRNGTATELIDHTSVLTNPRNRHLYLHGRTNNIYGSLGEVFWVMSGQVAINPVLNFFVPRAPNYSDDGMTWRGGYGHRLFQCDQINGVVETFNEDGRNSRRALISIYQPHFDSPMAIRSQGYPKSLDIPCSNMLWYWIRNNKLNCKLTMRSNDWIYGGSNINVLEFTILQELLLCLLQNSSENFRTLELGEYRHNVINMHLYAATESQAVDITTTHRAKNLQMLKAKETYPIKLNPSMDYMKMVGFLRSIYCALELEITSESLSMLEIFEASEVPTHGNQLYAYANLCHNYIKAKRNRSCNLSELGYSLSPDLKEAVLHSKFTPVEWKDFWK